MSKLLTYGLAIVLIVLFGAYRMDKYIATHPTNEPVAGSFSPAGGLTYRLGSSVGSTDVTIPLTSFKNRSDIPLTMTLLNTSIGYGTLDPQTSRSEFISFTGITQNANGSATLTGVTRGISDIYPYTASSTLRKTHAGQSVFILSDSPSLFAEYAVKQNAETISGVWTFSSTSLPILDQNPNAATWAGLATTTFITLGKLNDTALASAVAANETTQGYVELATATESGAGTSAGGTGARLVLPNSLATSSPTASCSVFCIPIATAGKLNSLFIATTSVYTWSAVNTFSGGLLATASSTFNATTSIAASSVTNNALILNGVKYAFPSSQGSSLQTFINDGSGNLTWGSISKIAFATTSQSYNTAATTWSFASTSIAGNTLGTSGGIRIRAYINTLDMATAVGNTLACKYGGSVVATQALTGSASTPNQFQGVVECVITANGTSAQQGVMIAQLEQGNGSSGGTAKLGINTVSVGTAAVDSTSARTLELIYTAGDSNASNGITVKFVTVEKIQ